MKGAHLSDVDERLARSEQLEAIQLRVGGAWPRGRDDGPMTSDATGQLATALLRAAERVDGR